MPPSFKDHVEEGFDDLIAIRATYILVYETASDDVENYVIAERLTNLDMDHEWSFSKIPHLIKTEVQLVMCYTYPDFPALKDLCDFEQPFTVENALGYCFTDHQTVIDTAGVNSEISNPMVYELGLA